MRRFFAAIGALFLACSAYADTMVVNSPGDGYLNLRSGPGANFAIIMRKPHQTTVDTLEYAGNWARVRHETGAVGWAHRKYIVSYHPGPTVLRVHSPKDGYLNLRTGPGTRFGIIKPMYNGTQVTILEAAGKWVRVRTGGGHEGWAYSDYLIR